MTANYLLKAMVGKAEYYFEYESADLWDALDEFFHDDWESLSHLQGSGRFPIDVYAMEEGQALRLYKFTFDAGIFNHFFDKGWVAYSQEPGQRYTLDMFSKDIERKDKVSNDATALFFYMWNSWSEQECKIAFRDGDYNHFWKKWCGIYDQYSRFGKVEHFFSDLSNYNRDKLLARAKELYDGSEGKQ